MTSLQTAGKRRVENPQQQGKEMKMLMPTFINCRDWVVQENSQSHTGKEGLAFITEESCLTEILAKVS